MLKKFSVFKLLFVFACLKPKAQDVYTVFSLQEYPVEFKYLTDYQVKRMGRMSYIITNGITEFYLKGYNLSNRFNADSLQRMFEKDLYNDNDIVNLQLREKGRGALGPHPADRLVMEFSAGDRLYKITAFMVYFHINHEYNALLFFFDMNWKNAESYEGVLINMGQTLRWGDNIPFRSVRDEATGLNFEIPAFWRLRPLTEGDAYGFLVDDGKARLTFMMKPSADSLGADRNALAERDAIKANPGIYKEQKFKAGRAKLPEKEIGGLLSGTYKEDVNGLLRPTLFRKNYYKRIVDGKLMDIQITLESPVVDAAHYSPLHKRILDSIKVPGTLFTPPKKKK